MSLELQTLLVSGVGSVNMITGPMGAGKSRTLLEQLRRAGRAGIERCLIRSTVDTRWAEAEDETPKVLLQTHGGERLTPEEGLMFIRTETLAEARAQIPNTCKIVAIDEGQFFDDLPDGCSALARDGMLVYVSALNGDKNQNPWENVSRLLANCESITKLAGWCQKCCRRPAHYTRLKPSAKASEQASGFEVGGPEKYEAVCRGCLLC
jgi:thymidine kinase